MIVRTRSVSFSMVRSAISAGTPVAAAYRAATWSAANGFGLRDRGLVAPGYRADLLLIDEDNPRSLAYQLSCLQEHVQHLPRGREKPFRTREEHREEARERIV